MAETEYIDLSNRVKITIAKQVLSDVLPQGPIDQEALANVLRQISSWETQLFEQTKIDSA